MWLLNDIFGWFRTVPLHEGIEDLKRRLKNAEKDAEYWRNEYGNKVAELGDLKEKIELERKLDGSTIDDLNELARALKDKSDRLQKQLDDATKSKMKVKSELIAFVQNTANEVDKWAY